MAAELILAYISIGAGMELVRYPSGNSFDLQPLIPYLPFNLHDFTLVGVWLVAVYGVLLIILAAGLWFGKKWAWMGSRPSSSTGHLDSGGGVSVLFFRIHILLSVDWWNRGADNCPFVFTVNNRIYLIQG